MLAAQAHQTLTDRVSPLLYATSVLGAAAALYALWSAARGRYRETIGRRSDRYRRLARLGTEAQLSFFVSVLGEPPAMRHTVVKDDYVELIAPGDPDFDPDSEETELQERLLTKVFTESTFIDRDYYVQALCDQDETVLAFSVTTRSKRFRPVFQVLRPPGPIERLRWRRATGNRYRPLVDIRLGRTTFADLDSADPDTFAPPHFKVAVGAHNHFYSEFAYFGNPGHYQSFAWTASDAARQGRHGDLMKMRQEIDGEEWPDPDATPGEEPEWDDMKAAQRFRQETVITTYTVIAGSLWLRNYPLSRFGPNENYVRTLP
jgi:hypothetical protein